MLPNTDLLLFALDQIHDGLMICQQNQGQYLIQYASAPVAQLAMLPSDSLPGQSWDCFLNESADTQSREQIQSWMQQQQSGQIRIKNYRIDGSSCWLDIKAIPVSPNLYCLLWIDISQKVATEHKLIAYKREIDALSAKIEKLSPQDPLTLLLNRKHFDLRSAEEWKRAVREQRYVSILLIDIDYFRNYNFTYGKSQGDLLLKTLGNIIGSLFHRPSDLVARYGGEEFVALLLDVTPEQIPKTAEILRQHIQQEEIPFTISPLLPFVTVSIGLVCTQAGPQLSLEQLLENADTALSKAKQSGRNRIESYIF